MDGAGGSGWVFEDSEHVAHLHRSGLFLEDIASISMGVRGHVKASTATHLTPIKL